MPWGINRDEIETTLRHWHPRTDTVSFLPYRSPRGLPRLFAGKADQIPIARHAVPSLVHVAIANDVGRSAAMGIAMIDSELDREEESSHSRTSRKSNMTSNNDDDSTVDAMGDFLTAAGQNARGGGDTAFATTQAIGKRLALGVAATINPLRADRAEFSRVIPEKVEAFSTAGMVVLKQSSQAGRQLMRFASNEIATTVHATNRNEPLL
jgi:hypothetical protein